MGRLNEETENALAKHVQGGVPFVSDPFAQIAADMGLSESEVIEQLQAWAEEGKLREISAVLEGSALGYESALVAAKVPEGRLDEVVEILNAHPTITHNYLRNHDYNVWFTIAAPLDMGIDPTLAALSRLTDVSELHPLRRTTTFKIGVNFDLKSRKSATERVDLSETRAVEASDRDKRCFRALQSPLPLVPQPFAELAERAGVTEAELLSFAKEHKGGALRRYVGTFRHRKLGVRGNGMGVWNVPEDRLQDVGQALAGAPEVSHCYARNRIADFAYNVYSMIHGPDEESCRDVAKRLSGEVGIDDYSILFSQREFKKVRLRYFLPELDEWWAKHGAPEAEA